MVPKGPGMYSHVPSLTSLCNGWQIGIFQNLWIFDLSFWNFLVLLRKKKERLNKIFPKILFKSELLEAACWKTLSPWKGFYSATAGDLTGSSIPVIIFHSHKQPWTGICLQTL